MTKAELEKENKNLNKQNNAYYVGLLLLSCISLMLAIGLAIGSNISYHKGLYENADNYISAQFEVVKIETQIPGDTDVINLKIYYWSEDIDILFDMNSSFSEVDNYEVGDEFIFTFIKTNEYNRYDIIIEFKKVGYKLIT